MKKSLLATFLISALVAALGITACSSGSASSSAASSASSEAASSASASAAASSEASAGESSSAAAAEGSAYAYAGTDPIELAVYKYMAEEVSKNFDKADASIPAVFIVNVDNANPDDVLVYGDFWVYNYNIEGDTLSCVSGGNFPGVMHLGKEGDGYVVRSFDVVADGAGFEESAKELFGDNFDAFMKIYSDSDTRDQLRKAIVSNYVKLNGLAVKQYQDYGWDPVQLDQ